MTLTLDGVNGPQPCRTCGEPSSSGGIDYYDATQPGDTHTRYAVYPNSQRFGCALHPEQGRLVFAPGLLYGSDAR